MSINFGKLPDQLVSFLESTEWHLESFAGDKHMLRVVYPSIFAASRWFSDEWPVICEDFIRPAHLWSNSRAHYHTPRLS